MASEHSVRVFELLELFENTVLGNTLCSRTHCSRTRVRVFGSTVSLATSTVIVIKITSAGAIDREFVLDTGASQSSSRALQTLPETPSVSSRLWRSSPRAAPDAPEVAQGLPKPTQRLRVPPELSGANPGRAKCSQVRCLRTKFNFLDHSHRKRGMQ